MIIANSTQSEFIDIKKIRLDGGTQFRESINQDKVKEYKELMLDDVVFKPVDVVFDGEFYFLVDGFHRYFAIKAMGVNTLEAKVTEGTVEDAVRMARRANSAHGMPRTNETKRRVILSALNDPNNKGMSAREIAKECQVSHTLVLNVIKSSEGGINSTGTEMPTEETGNNSTFVEGGNNSTPTEKPSMTQDFAPSDEELEANQLKMQADMDLAIKIIEADDILASLHAEVKRLSDDNASLQSRVNALMREKDQAVDLLKSAQRKLDRLYKQGLQTT
jgi:hypothetical protein